ncbi:zinc finger protein 729-like [Topomyia yanbarensis]|uniref:zinc finger protein 729-like n=1 Tax=Topomyia yanbarensis TaxID=2498891 RepID=UPI00273C7B31|nr:zinc finger protein 729-like [Topomyia yanbarensis]
MHNVQLVCRICLSKDDGSDPFINIIPKEQPDSELPILVALGNICGLEVSPDDSYSKLICPKCHTRLEDAYNLRLLAQRSEVTFASMSPKSEADMMDDDFRMYLDSEDSASTISLESDDEFTDMDFESDEENSLVPYFNGRVQSANDGQACCACDEVFQSKKDLRKHSAEKHRTNKPAILVVGSEYKCNVCYEHFESTEAVTAHKAGKNNVRPPIQCEYCRCKFRVLEDMNEHKSTFHKDNLFKCCGCSSVFEDRIEFLTHCLFHKHKVKQKASQLKHPRKKYDCLVCYKQFKSLEEQRVHELAPYGIVRTLKSAKEVAASESKPAEKSTANGLCCGCFLVYETNSELKAHQDQVHKSNRTEKNKASEKNKAECGGCYRHFRSQFAVNKHLVMAASRKRFDCSKCPALRHTMQDIMNHYETHKGPKSFLCCGCPKRFDSTEELEEHSKEVHAKKPKIYHDGGVPVERPFECNVCYRRYNTRKDVRNHQQQSYTLKVFVCDICGMGFKQKAGLTTHLLTHETEAKYPCPECGKKYKTPEKVKACLFKHQNPRAHQCKICNAPFDSREKLNSHLISHSDERRYKCEICEKTFKRSFHKRKHMTQHSSEPWYTCRFCPSMYRSTIARSKHEVKHTKVHPYQCEICNKGLLTRDTYIKHYERHIDESDKVFQCDRCEVHYSKDHFLSNHLMYTHLVQPTDENWKKKFNRRKPGRQNVNETEPDAQSE